MEGFTPPDFRYVVLDVNRYSPEELRPVEDVTSGVFLMERHPIVGRVREGAQATTQLFLQSQEPRIVIADSFTKKSAMLFKKPEGIRV